MVSVFTKKPAAVKNPLAAQTTRDKALARLNPVSSTPLPKTATQQPAQPTSAVGSPTPNLPATPAAPAPPPTAPPTPKPPTGTTQTPTKPTTTQPIQRPKPIATASNPTPDYDERIKAKALDRMAGAQPTQPSSSGGLVNSGSNSTSTGMGIQVVGPGNRGNEQAKAGSINPLDRIRDRAIEQLSPYDPTPIGTGVAGSQIEAGQPVTGPTTTPGSNIPPDVIGGSGGISADPIRAAPGVPDEATTTYGEAIGEDESNEDRIRRLALERMQAEELGALDMELRGENAANLMRTQATTGLGGFGLSGASAALGADVANKGVRNRVLTKAELSRGYRNEGRDDRRIDISERNADAANKRADSDAAWKDFLRDMAVDELEVTEGRDIDGDGDEGGLSEEEQRKADLLEGIRDDHDFAPDGSPRIPLNNPDSPQLQQIPEESYQTGTTYMGSDRDYDYFEKAGGGYYKVRR